VTDGGTGLHSSEFGVGIAFGIDIGFSIPIPIPIARGAMLKLFSSLRTTLVLCAALCGLSVWGSFAIQRSPEAYATIERGILFEWLLREGVAAPLASWWIFAMVAVAGLLSANTIVCAAVRLARAARHRSLSGRTLCAHLAHLGFLLVLAAHVVGSCWGFRSDGHPAFGGQSFTVPQRPGWSFAVGRVSVELAPEGYPKALEANLSVRAGERVIATDVVRVNQPVSAEGVAVYLKDVHRSLRGWTLGTPQGQILLAEIGRPVAVPGGTLMVMDWTRMSDGSPALRLEWVPTGEAAVQGWVAPSPGRPLPLPQGPSLIWGEMAIDTLATFDVRYDPGIRPALAGGALLSVSLVPLLWPRRRQPALHTPEARAPEPPRPNPFEATTDAIS
jgi:hypothetical protein